MDQTLRPCSFTPRQLSEEGSSVMLDTVHMFDIHGTFWRGAESERYGPEQMAADSFRSTRTFVEHLRCQTVNC